MGNYTPCVLDQIKYLAVTRRCACYDPSETYLNLMMVSLCCRRLLSCLIIIAEVQVLLQNH